MEQSHSKTLFAYLGHHKCASTFINQIVINTLRPLGKKAKIEYIASELSYEYHKKEEQKQAIDVVYDSVENGDFDIFCHGNADNKLVKKLESRNFKAFHVIRDPRDIVVSGYFSHKNSHPVHPIFNPWLSKYRESLNSHNKDEGLLLEIDYCTTYFKRLNDWNYSNPNIYETKFETLIRSPEEEFRRIFKFLGVQIKKYDILLSSKIVLNRLAKYELFNTNECPNFIFERVLKQHRYKKISGGRKAGIVNDKSHYRKGKPGDWKNHFKKEHKERFKTLYPGLLAKLKYEKDDNW